MEIKEEEIISLKKGIIEDAKTLILFRENLCREYKDTKIKNINYSMFKYDNNPSVRATRKIAQTELCLFIDKNGDTKILKSRWGNIGIVK